MCTALLDISCCMELVPLVLLPWPRSMELCWGNTKKLVQHQETCHACLPRSCGFWWTELRLTIELWGRMAPGGHRGVASGGHSYA